MPDDGPGVSLGGLEDGIALLRFERPRQLNALTDDSVAEIGRLLDASAPTRDARARRHRRGRGFCAGFDLGLGRRRPGSAELGETPAWMQRQESFARS
jgi:enoyl-CoA hydratase/carnithine racemase